MATTYGVGNIPPQVLWTIVRGDSSSFQIYVTDDQKTPLTISDWTIDMEIRRNGALVLAVYPAVRDEDGDGEFTVTLTPTESELVNTNDIFDVQLTNTTDEEIVWTVIQGKINVIEDVTAATSQSGS